MSARSLVVVTAGLRQPSSTRLLADQIAAAVSRRAGDTGLDLDTQVVEIRDVAHDLVNNLLAGFPSPELEMRLELVSNADALIAVSPIFTGSFSGLFKSFFDVLGQDRLIDKPVLLAATGGTARHSLALEYAMRPMFAYMRALTIPTSVYAAPEDWGGASASGTLSARIDRAAAELTAEVSRRTKLEAADPFQQTPSFDELMKAVK